VREILRRFLMTVGIIGALTFAAYIFDMAVLEGLQWWFKS